MFTDIAGYTRLMRDSEAAAVALRERHRRVFQAETAAFGGEIIHYYGDGTLSIFDSSVNAVRCAAALQRQFTEAPALPVRIGIHTGDIILTEDDIIGDSVNLASRVESLAVPGSVLVTGKVADEIRSQPDLPLHRVGAFQFKSDGKKREVYALNLPGLHIPDSRTIRGKLEPEQPLLARTNVRLALAGLIVTVLLASLFLPRFRPGPMETADIRKLAVLPFSNPTPDTSQGHLIEGVHEAMISELHRAGIDVVPRSSMLAYRQSDKGIHDIARELGVDALIQGTVLRWGDSLNIDLLLIQDDGAGGDIVWDRSFPAEMKDLFILYRDVTKAIAGEIELALSPTVTKQLDATARVVNGAAMEVYLKGRQHAEMGSYEEVDRAIAYYEEALAIDPEFGPAYTGLVEAYLLKGFGALDPFEAHTQFRIYAQRALDLDPAVEDAHHLRAMIHIFSELDWAAAEEELKLALAETPDSPYLLDTYCQLLWAVGRLQESVEMGERAVATGPDNHFTYCDLGWAYYYHGEIAAARDMIQTIYDKFPGSNCAYHISLDFRLRLLEDLTDQQLLGMLDEVSGLSGQRADDPYFRYGLRAKILMRLGRTSEARALLDETEDMSQAQYVDPIQLATMYVELGDRDKAFEKLEQAYLQRSFLLMYTLKASPDFDPLRDDPRYDALLKRMNLAGGLKS